MCIEDLLPKGYLLRKIDAAVDFTKIYEIVEELYCKDNGRPNTDPVVSFKTAIIKHLYGISSLRRTACDKNRYVLDVTLNSGYIHDSVAFDGLYYKLCEVCPEMRNVVADAGCKTP